jgi:flagellar basal-body rod protein FlgF
MRDTSQGNLEQTGATYDVAIAGNGFFQVQTPSGMRYTRDGHFSLDNNGNLATSQGYPVQGDGGAITIAPTDGQVVIAPDGTISSVLNGVTNLLGKFKVVDFPAMPPWSSRVPISIPPTRRPPCLPISMSGRARWKPPMFSR